MNSRGDPECSWAPLGQKKLGCSLEFWQSPPLASPGKRGTQMAWVMAGASSHTCSPASPGKARPRVRGRRAFPHYARGKDRTAHSEHFMLITY